MRKQKPNACEVKVMQFGLMGSSWKNSWQKKINHLRPSLSPTPKLSLSTRSQGLPGPGEIH